MPHHRITAGDTGKVTKTTRGITENLEIFALFGQGVDQTKRQQVRQVTGGGQHFVVMAYVHKLDLRTQRHPQLAH